MNEGIHLSLIYDIIYLYYSITYGIDVTYLYYITVYYFTLRRQAQS